MTTAVTGTIQQGRIQLDQPIGLPDNCRVQVMVQPLTSTPQSTLQAFEEFVKFADEHPVDSGGVRYTRDQLHERR